IGTVRDRTWESPKYSIKNAKAFEMARANRKQSTVAEDMLWQYLRNNQLGEKFRRQHPIETFIADFVCLQKGLIIEVDGGYHEDKDQKEYDRFRTETLESLGFKVVRFTNEAVLQNINSVTERIRNILSEQKKSAQ